MADIAMLHIRENKQIKFELIETTVAATEEESVILAEKLTQVAIPLEVLLQALNIAKYDKAAAFRYADNYLNKGKKPKMVLIKSLFAVEKRSFNKNIKNTYIGLPSLARATSIDSRTINLDLGVNKIGI